MSGNDNLSILHEIVIPMHMDTMKHDTRGLLASSCTMFRALVSNYYDKLLDQIKQRTITTPELFRQNTFDIFSLLKHHNPNIDVAAYPQCECNGFFKRKHPHGVVVVGRADANEYYSIDEYVSLNFEERLEITVKRFTMKYGPPIVRTKHFITMAILEWMLQNNVNIVFRYRDEHGQNLLHMAVDSCNYPAVKRLLEIDAEHVHELKHEFDDDNLLPHHLLQDVEFAALLSPELIPMAEYLLGNSHAELKRRRQSDQDQASSMKVWELPVHMPRPLSSLPDDQIQACELMQQAAFALIVFCVKRENRVDRMKQFPRGGE